MTRYSGIDAAQIVILLTGHQDMGLKKGLQPYVGDP